jgi:hypothetical protein
MTAFSILIIILVNGGWPGRMRAVAKQEQMALLPSSLALMKVPMGTFMPEPPRAFALSVNVKTGAAVRQPMKEADPDLSPLDIQ